MYNIKIPQLPDVSGGFLLYYLSRLKIFYGDEVMWMRILLADNQPNVRFALRVLLEKHVGFEIVDEIDDAEMLLNRTEETNPDVVLLGWELPGLPAIGPIVTLRKVCPDVSVIALSGRPEARGEALSAGVDAFVSKVDPPDHLLVAIEDCRC